MALCGTKDTPSSASLRMDNGKGESGDSRKEATQEKKGPTNAGRLAKCRPGAGSPTAQDTTEPARRPRKFASPPPHLPSRGTAEGPKGHSAVSAQVGPDAVGVGAPAGRSHCCTRSIRAACVNTCSPKPMACTSRTLRSIQDGRAAICLRVRRSTSRGNARRMTGMG